MWLVHMHACLALGSTRHQRSYINAGISMLGGTRTSHAGNCNRCGQQKPTRSHAGTVCLPAESSRRKRSFPSQRTEPGLGTCLFGRFMKPWLGQLLGTAGMKGEGGSISEYLLGIYFGFQKWPWLTWKSGWKSRINNPFKRSFQKP